MNRYCNELTAIETGANAVADVELGKNLLLHFIEVSEGITELKHLIRQEREKSEIVATRQDVMIEMIMFVNKILFKIKNFGEGLEIPYNMNGLATDLEFADEDYKAGINLSYHIATLTHDIASVQRTIEEEGKLGHKTAPWLLEFEEQLSVIKAHYENLNIRC